MAVLGGDIRPNFLYPLNSKEQDFHDQIKACLDNNKYTLLENKYENIRHVGRVKKIKVTFVIQGTTFTYANPFFTYEENGKNNFVLNCHRKTMDLVQSHFNVSYPVNTGMY